MKSFFLIAELQQMSFLINNNHISSTINDMVIKFLFDTHVICGIKLYCINYFANLIMSGSVPRIEGPC